VLRRHRDEFGAFGLEALLDLGRAHDLCTRRIARRSPASSRPESPIQLLTSNPGTDSATVSIGQRRRARGAGHATPQLARAHVRQAVGIVAKIIAAPPANRSVIAGALPLYGDVNDVDSSST
jgi:hypothetical protein